MNRIAMMEGIADTPSRIPAKIDITICPIQHEN